MNYVTLHDIKEQLNVTGTSDDVLLQKWINKTTELINWWKDRRYDAYKDTIYLDCPQINSLRLGDYHFGEVSPFELSTYEEILLKVGRDLLEVVELLNGDEEEVTSDDYLLLPKNEYPKTHIGLKSAADVVWVPDSDGNYEEVIALTGIFGNHYDWENAFVDSGNTIQVGIDASETQISVQNVNGVANDLLSPRFSAGNMLKLLEADGTFEYVLVTSATHDEDYSDSITVVRGYNGTSGIAHVADRAIYVYRIPGQIEQIAMRLVQWRYRQKDSDVFDKVYNLATQSVTTPSALPVDVERILGPRKFVI